MLFWIFTFILVAAVVWWILDDDFDNRIISGATSVVFGIIVIVSAVCIAVDHSTDEATLASYQQRYDSLVYQYDNNLYDNDNDLGKKELMNQIMEWNEDLAKKQIYQDDFWVGIYYADIYDQLQFIEYH